MDLSIQERKRAIRKTVRETLATMTAEHRAWASGQAVRLLLEQEHWKKAQSVLLYVPLGDEPDILPCFAEAKKAGKLVAVPRY